MTRAGIGELTDTQLPVMCHPGISIRRQRETARIQFCVDSTTPSRGRSSTADPDLALERLYAATAAVSAAIDDEPRLLATVAEQFASLVGARYGALGILGDDGTLNGFYTHGLTNDEEQFLRPTPPVGHGILGAMLVEGRPLRIDDIDVDSRRAGMPVGHPPMHTFLGVPLIASSRVIGRLYATERNGGPFTPADETLAMGFAAAAAVAIESAWRTTRLVESERLRAAGELAIGISHDFNNLLSTIIGRVEVMLTSVTDTELAANLEAIRRAARDGAVIAGRMRRFGHAVEFDDFRPIDVREVVQDAIEFTRPRWQGTTVEAARPLQIQVVTDHGDVSDIDGDPVSIREALVNLIFNAIDALPNGGTVTVRTHPGPGPSTVIEVADDGTGIPAGAVAHVFAPFFTTKGARGSGLGLAMVKRVVDGHRGTIDVETAEGRGTRFTMAFPAIALSPSARQVPSQLSPRALPPLLANDQAYRSPSSIVIVDDQPDVLETVVLLLRLDGHKVLGFTNAPDALAAVSDVRPDLVITDLSMPELTGWDVAREVSRIAPGTPVIMLTGLGRAIPAHEAQANGVSCVVPKPPDRDMLREAIRSSLARPGTQRRSLRILVVDDSDGFRSAIVALLRAHGHDVDEADGAETARAAISDEVQFDVVLLDAHLHDGDPRAVCDDLRTAHPHTCVWAMSGSDVDTMRSLVPDADLHIPKIELSTRILDLGATVGQRGSRAWAQSGTRDA